MSQHSPPTAGEVHGNVSLWVKMYVKTEQSGPVGGTPCPLDPHNDNPVQV